MSSSKTNSLTRKILPWAGILSLLFLVVFLIRNCDKGPKPLRVAIKSPVAIALIDANRLLDKPVPKAKITLTDPDSMVITSDGQQVTTLEIEGGVFCLGLKKEARVSDTMPYRFTLKVEIEGYSTNIRNILISSDDGQYVPIFMAQLQDPPAGMSTAVGSTPLVNGILGTSFPIVPNVSAPGALKDVKITMQPGTQFIYCDRDAPTAKTPEKLNYRVSIASPRSLATGRTFPGGTLITDAIGKNGEKVAEPHRPIYFSSAGWINLEMDADGREIDGFSKPVNISMPISDSLVNILAKPKPRFYRAGDTIPIWSLNDRGVWSEEAFAIVFGEPGKLSAQMNISHLSTWNLDCQQSPCVATTQDLIINYNNSAASVNLYSELITVSDGQPIGITGLSTDDHELTYNSGGGTFSIARAPNGQQLVFVAYDNTAAPGVPPTTGVLASTPFFTINCATQPNQPRPSISIPSTQMQQVQLAFDYVESNISYYICGNAVWFRGCLTCDADDAGGPNNCEQNNITSYRYGGLLNKSDGTVTFYKTGAPFSGVHCIRIWYNNNPLDVPIDFSVTSAAVVPITARLGNTNISAQRWFDAGIYHIRITGPLPIIPVCI